MIFVCSALQFTSQSGFVGRSASGRNDFDSTDYRVLFRIVRPNLGLVAVLFISFSYNPPKMSNQTARASTLQNLSAEGGQTKASYAKYTAAEVKQTGTPVSVGQTTHELSNHFIEQSRKYFPNVKLRTYICGCSLMRRCAVICWVASFLGALSLVESIGMTPALIFLLLDLIWVAIFIQHE